MNRLSNEKRIRILTNLCEGMSIRGTARAVGVGKNAVLRLIREVGPACERFLDRFVRDVACKRIEMDEMHQFIYARDKNLPDELKLEHGFGTVWTWLCTDPDSRLILSYLVGGRDAETCKVFVSDVANRLADCRVEISTDAWKAYPAAISSVFRDEAISYGIIDKDYGSTSDDSNPARRYSPGKIKSMRTRVVTGDPDMHICTSHAERMNLSVRMHMKRYARLTNAHSKDIYHHNLALSMHVWFYNFARINSAVKMTPAQAAGLTDYKFKVADMLTLDMWTSRPMEQAA